MHSTEEQGNVETERSFQETKLKKVTSLKTLTLGKIDVRALQGLLFVNSKRKQTRTHQRYIDFFARNCFSIEETSGLRFAFYL